MSQAIAFAMLSAMLFAVILCYLLLPNRYYIDMSLAMSFATMLVMVFCHLVYYQIYHWLFLWYVTSYCIGCAISNAIFNAINFDLKNHYIYDFIIFGHVIRLWLWILIWLSNCSISLFDNEIALVMCWLFHYQWKFLVLSIV